MRTKSSDFASLQFLNSELHTQLICSTNTAFFCRLCLDRLGTQSNSKKWNWHSQSERLQIFVIGTAVVVSVPSACWSPFADHQEKIWDNLSIRHEIFIRVRLDAWDFYCSQQHQREKASFEQMHLVVALLLLLVQLLALTQTAESLVKTMVTLWQHLGDSPFGWSFNASVSDLCITSEYKSCTSSIPCPKGVPGQQPRQVLVTGFESSSFYLLNFIRFLLQ